MVAVLIRDVPEELRDHIYRAAYIALIEELAVSMITTDVRLSRVPGIRSNVRAVTA